MITGGAVTTEQEWLEQVLVKLAYDRGFLREGIEIALKHLQANRKTLAIDALTATLTHQTW